MTQISLTPEGVLSLSGILDYRTGPALREQGRKLIQSVDKTELRLDCSAVEKSSSVGIALVLAFMRDAQHMNKTLVVGELPLDMQQIAHVCELTPLLSPQ